MRDARPLEGVRQLCATQQLLFSSGLARVHNTEVLICGSPKNNPRLAAAMPTVSMSPWSMDVAAELLQSINPHVPYWLGPTIADVVGVLRDKLKPTPSTPYYWWGFHTAMLAIRSVGLAESRIEFTTGTIAKSASLEALLTHSPKLREKDNEDEEGSEEGADPVLRLAYAPSPATHSILASLKTGESVV